MNCMRFQRIISGLCIGFVLVGLNASFVFAAAKPTPVNIFVNDAELSVYDEEVKKDMPALIYNGRTLMPLKKTFALFGLEVKWDAKNQSIEALTDTGKTIWLQIGNKNAKVAGKTVSLDVPARVIDKRTYVPLAFIAQAVGHEAIWDSKLKLVKIYTDGTEFLNLSAIPKAYSNEPNRLNNNIFFDGANGKMITVSKTDLAFDDAINLVSSMLYVQSEDFQLTVNDNTTKIGVYEDKFMGMERCNLIISKSGAVFILEIRGLNVQEATEFTKKFVK